MIKPFGDNVLVELQSEYKKALITEARLGGTKKMGLCVAISQTLNNPDSHATELFNKIVYFDEFEDTTNYKIGNKTYALIEVKNIRGYEDGINIHSQDSKER